MLNCLFVSLALLSLADRSVVQTAQVGVDALLDSDRAFSAAAADAPTPAAGLTAMLDAEVVMPVVGRGHVAGREPVARVFAGDPALGSGTMSWAPIRGGISADGTQGFSYGYMTLSAAPPDERHRKYLAYWIRRPEGWRVVAYRQAARPDGTVSMDLLPASLPGFSAPPIDDEASLQVHRLSLHAAEQNFSDHAQTVGLRTAFRDYGREDAMNMSQGAEFQVGLDAIAAGFPEGVTTSPLRWSTDRSFVASSGDLGVSIGTISRNGPPPEGRPATIPFFTIWRRNRLQDPWRYVAE